MNETREWTREHDAVIAEIEGGMLDVPNYRTDRDACFRAADRWVAWDGEDSTARRWTVGSTTERVARCAPVERWYFATLEDCDKQWHGQGWTPQAAAAWALWEAEHGR